MEFSEWATARHLVVAAEELDFPIGATLDWMIFASVHWPAWTRSVQMRLRVESTWMAPVCAPPLQLTLGIDRYYSMVKAPVCGSACSRLALVTVAQHFPYMRAEGRLKSGVFDVEEEGVDWSLEASCL